MQQLLFRHLPNTQVSPFLKMVNFYIHTDAHLGRVILRGTIRQKPSVSTRYLIAYAPEYAVVDRGAILVVSTRLYLRDHRRWHFGEVEGGDPPPRLRDGGGGGRDVNSIGGAPATRDTLISEELSVGVSDTVGRVWCPPVRSPSSSWRKDASGSVAYIELEPFEYRDDYGRV